MDNILNKKIILLLALFFAVNLSMISSNREDSIKAVVNRLSEALSNSDMDKVKADLNSDFSIHIATWPASGWYLSQILNSKTIESVEYISINSISEDAAFVNALFKNKNGKSEKAILAFDSQNKILFVDYFDQLYSSGRFSKSVLKDIIPFTIEDGSIILSLKLNNDDVLRRFLFDTGANGMAIGRSLADSIGLSISRKQQTSVVGARLEVSISSGNEIHLNDSLSLKKQNIAIFEQIGHGVDGIIGLNLCGEYIVNVNFDTQQLYLYSFGDYDFGQDGEVLDIIIPEGVILVPCAINIVGKKEVSGHFVFDTGANYHAIAFEQFVRKNRLLLSGFKSEEQASTVSLGVSTPVFKGKASEFRIGEKIHQFDMPITLQASGGQSSNDKNAPDGSVGIQLLDQFNFTIDMLRKKIHLIPYKKHE